MDAALRHALGNHYTGISVMFGIGLLTLCLPLAGHSLKDFSARVILTITGHLRARPDPWLECALRAAFAEFDQELALIMQDGGAATPAHKSPEPAPRAAEPPAPGDTLR